MSEPVIALKYKLINTNQFGFRSNHSTEHTLISLIETIKKSLDNDEIVCGVFIVFYLKN